MSRWMMICGRVGVLSMIVLGFAGCELLDIEKDDETGDPDVDDDGDGEGDLDDVEVSAEGAPVVEWHVGEGTSGEEHVHEGLQTADGGYVAIGHTEDSSGSRTTDMLVVKVDADGDLEWSKRLVHQARWTWESPFWSSKTAISPPVACAVPAVGPCTARCGWRHGLDAAVP